jgi:hypothetical protein
VVQHRSLLSTACTWTLTRTRPRPVGVADGDAGLGADHLRGRTGIELLLPQATFVDVEAALEGAHRAESCIAEGRWVQAWGPAGIAYHVATRPFLTGLEAPWIDEWQRRLEEVRLRGLNALPPPASALAARRWPRPRNGPGC